MSRDMLSTSPSARRPAYTDSYDTSGLRIRSNIFKAFVAVARAQIWCLLSALRTQALLCLGHFGGLFTLQEIKCAISRFSQRNCKSDFMTHLKILKYLSWKDKSKSLLGRSRKRGREKVNKSGEAQDQTIFQAHRVENTGQCQQPDNPNSLSMHWPLLRKGKNLKERKW